MQNVSSLAVYTCKFSQKFDTTGLTVFTFVELKQTDKPNLYAWLPSKDCKDNLKLLRYGNPKVKLSLLY